MQFTFTWPIGKFDVNMESGVKTIRLSLHGRPGRRTGELPRRSGGHVPECLERGTSVGIYGVDVDGVLTGRYDLTLVVGTIPREILRPK